MWREKVVFQFYLSFLYKENSRILRTIIGELPIYISELLYRFYSISGNNY